MKVEVIFFIISFFYCCDCLNSPEKIRILARNNYKLVPYFSKQYIRKYNLKNHHKEELIQYGYEGFMKKPMKNLMIHVVLNCLLIIVLDS